jgi:hypothetical protein
MNRLPKDVAVGPQASALLNRLNLWPQGHTISWATTDSKHDALIRASFATWAIGTGLDFEKIDEWSNADIRIDFDRGAGSWSYIGSQARQVPDWEATMNFGWDITNDQATVYHEIGHAVGLPHEHQSANRFIEFDEANVYADLSLQGWSRLEAELNVFNTTPVSQDVQEGYFISSIMHYGMPPSWISHPDPYDSQGTPINTRLAESDIAWAAEAYPPLDGVEPITSPVGDTFKVEGPGSYTITSEAKDAGRYSFVLAGAGFKKWAIIQNKRVMQLGDNFSKPSAVLAPFETQLDQGSFDVIIEHIDDYTSTLGVWEGQTYYDNRA